MCGIVGYIGERYATPILLEGLRRLEYRGYDSAGIAVLTPEQAICVEKAEGKLLKLVQALDGHAPLGSLGIGHTRWATHGAPNQMNAHPHTDCTGRIVVVHNGIIENHATLRTELISRGHRFSSETDTEVIAHLIEETSAGSDNALKFVDGVRAALRRVQGSYAIAAFCQDEPEMLVGARLFSPLVVGIGDGENYLASDIPALLGQTHNALLLEDGEVVEILPNRVTISNLEGKVIRREPFYVNWDAQAAEKGGYPHFFLKEIHEQPSALTNGLRGRLDGDQPNLPALASLDLKRVERVYLVACGTAYHAGLIGQSLIENWTRLPTKAVVGSEFRYADPLLDDRTLVILISQSGETADTLASFHLAKAAGAQTIAIANVVGSSITRGTDAVLYLQVGPEIGVAASKSFTGQLMMLYLLGLHLARTRRSMNDSEVETVVRGLGVLPSQITRILELDSTIKVIAEEYVNRHSFFYFGRRFGFPIALEGALKLKEISYIHAEGYPSGELKHGPIAMLDPTIPVMAIATASPIYDKVISNIQEVRARRAQVIAIATEGDDEIRHHADQVIYVPPTLEPLSAVLSVIPLQLFAYHVAVARGCDVDQPRNLAKSVTVE